MDWERGHALRFKNPPGGGLLQERGFMGRHQSWAGLNSVWDMLTLRSSGAIGQKCPGEAGGRR